jgi:hypothetical protein
MPANADWQRIQTLEDLMAKLVAIDDLAQCVRTHAWRQGDWRTVFRCADDILANTAVLRREMSARWESLINEARQ